MSLLVIAAIAIALFSIGKLDILPNKYFLILIIALLLIWSIPTLLLVLPGKKGHKVKAIIAFVLSFSMICGCACLTYASGQLFKTMQAITNTTIVTTEYGVYVRTDDAAQKLEDVKDYTIGICYISGDESLNKALASLEEELGYALNTVTYPNVPELVNALYLGKINAIILDSGYVSFFEDFEHYADFPNRTKCVHYLSVTEEIVTPTEPPTEPPTNIGDDSDKNDIEPFVLYISGSDTRKPTLSKSRSDVNILAVVNPQTKQILLVNTPRGFYIPNPAGNGALDKLTHCGNFGINCSIQALSDFYSISIDHYAQINFTGFKTLIDAIGGINVYSDMAFSGENFSYNIGLNEMDGEKALEFARTRKGIPGGDNTRGKNQMKVITAVVDKLSSTGTLIGNYSEILASLEGMFQTDMPMELISGLVKMQLSDMSAWDVQSYAVTGKSTSAITFSMPGQYLSVKIPDTETIEHATNLINRVLAGDVLTSADMTLPK